MSSVHIAVDPAGPAYVAYVLEDDGSVRLLDWPPPHPGPRPPWWRPFARRKWGAIMDRRASIKEFNFGYLYGRRAS